MMMLRRCAEVTRLGGLIPLSTIILLVIFAFRSTLEAYLTRGDNPVYKAHLKDQILYEAQKRVKAQPDNAQAHLALASTLPTEVNGEYNRQIDIEYRVALRLDPNLRVAKEDLACLHLSFKLYREAVNDYTELSKIDPSTYNYMSLAMAMSGLGRHSEAIEFIGKAQKLDRVSPEYFVWMADEYHMVKQDDVARLLWTKALSLSGSTEDWRWHSDARKGLAALANKKLMRKLDESIRTQQR